MVQDMLTETLEFVKLYIDLLNKSLAAMNGKLSRAQQAWLCFCLTAMILTNSVCWKAWERWSGGKYSDSALSWMLRNSPIPWNFLLIASIKLILKRFGIRQGVLVIDDSDHERSKNTTKIGFVHRIKDKKNDGYYLGQNLVFLILVTDIITLPVGFAFYEPDPAQKKWEKENKKLKEKGVKKSNRPSKPEKNTKYPTKLDIALSLLSQFIQAGFEIKIRCILADAFYGSADFVERASKLNGGMQVISQIRSNQLVRNKKGLLVDVKQHFASQKSIKKKVILRGGVEKIIYCCAQNLYVDAHRKKRLIIAIKYSDEKEYRYIIASDLSWQDLDIIQAYSLRWLIEVFFQDWKSYEGWCNLAKQQGVEGSSRCVILSLLLDHSLFFHDAQQPCIENKLPLNTIGSIIEDSRLQIITNKISAIIDNDKPQDEFKVFQEYISCMRPRRVSEKHMCHHGFRDVFLEAA